MLLLALVFLSIALQIITRFVLRDPLFWTEEAARYLYVWMVAIGSADVVRSRSHITMDVFYMLLPVRLRLALQLVFHVAIFGCLAVLAWYGTLGTMRAHSVMSVALRVPESLLYGALPVGAVLMALRVAFIFTQDVVALIRGEVEDTGEAA
ncbi:TRAP transporter small permease [Psychromarinibacter sediminicola]|nr:TRAP transporter small permease [Psychromarinibacter sediminicola]